MSGRSGGDPCRGRVGRHRPGPAGQRAGIGAGQRARTQTGQLLGIVRDAGWLMAAFRAARALDLPDWWIVSGAIYNTVWNALTGRASDHGVKDIDLFYFDPDTSWAAEDAVIRRAAPAFAPRPPVEIRNQARVHLWYEARFGTPCPALTSSRDAIDRFACKTHCIGLRLRKDDRFELHAPFGLDDIFALRVVPNPSGDNRATHEAKAARQKALWPELEVLPWPG